MSIFKGDSDRALKIGYDKICCKSSGIALGLPICTSYRGIIETQTIITKLDLENFRGSERYSLFSARTTASKKFGKVLKVAEALSPHKH
jgi:hypothetical protein